MNFSAHCINLKYFMYSKKLKLNKICLIYENQYI